MAEDTRSTSQRTSVKDDQTGIVQGFDVRSWQGLTEVLKVARASGLSDSTYAQFRDLVLQYAQRGGDVALRKQIEQALTSFKKEPAQEKDTTHLTTKEEQVVKTNTTEQKIEPREVQMSSATPKEPSLGTRRPTPSFLPVHVHDVHQPKPEISPVVPPSTASESASSETSPAPTAPVPHVETAPETPTPPPIPAVVPQQQPIPEPLPTPTTSTEVLPTAATQQSASSVPAPVVSPDPSVPPQSSGMKTMDEYKARIAAIKHDVNMRVGNPVALIDAKNQIGRTYMSALLAAMKATGPGATVRIEDAMVTLEKAYEEIITHPITAPLTAKVSPQMPPAVDPIETLEHTTVPQPAPIANSSSHTSEIPVPQPVIPAQQPAFTPTREKEPSHKKTTSVHPTAIPTAKPQSRAQTASLPKIPSLIELEQEALANAPTGVPSTPVTPPSTQPPPSVLSQTVSVPTSPHTPTNPPMAPTYAEAPIGQAELFTAEVTNALTSLLHEWNIFKSSGLFGMGPSGAEHPLYVTLSRLSMGEIVAGRWENAKPDVIFTIKEYVDAWRHEQGVAYNPTETFEHYLRRVVRRILKRQSGNEDSVV